jgi:hypothetical protein
MRHSARWGALSLTLTSVMLVSVFVILRDAGNQSVVAAPLVNLIWPLSGSSAPDVISITSPFGPRWQASQNRYDYHSGLDIKAPLGAPVHAVASGTVEIVGFLSGDAGLSVVISHPQLSLYTTYLHLDMTNTQPGAVVSQGQIIGFVGSSGTTEFTHLHFEIRLGLTDYPTTTRNPMGYLPRSDVTTPSLQIIDVANAFIYSPTVTILITVPRAELDLNQITLTLRDRSSGLVLDDQSVDFNQRVNTGADSLNQNGIQVTPAHFNETVTEYALTALFYNLQALDSFTVTAHAADLAGHVVAASAIGLDQTPPGKIDTLSAAARSNGARLAWIAPGDNDFNGQAATYEVRYTTTLIADSFLWAKGIPLPNPPAPITGGLQQTWLVTQPFTYPVYFAMRAIDDEGNVSLISNVALAQPTVFLPLVSKN